MMVLDSVHACHKYFSMCCRAPTKLAVVAKSNRTNKATRVCAVAENKKEMVAVAAAGALLIGNAMPAHADLVEDLLAKSQANAELHNKQRLASSYSNFARSRTVSDGTCKFPENVLGCDVGEYAGDVKYIADDVKIECEGKEAGKCASTISIPQRNN